MTNKHLTTIFIFLSTRNQVFVGCMRDTSLTDIRNYMRIQWNAIQFKGRRHIMVKTRLIVG